MRSFNKKCIFIPLPVLFLFFPAAVNAHPHMFASAQLEFVWAEDRLTGVYETWQFDRFFSADIMQGYDLNRDGVFNTAETQDVYANAFINTKNYYYFTFIRQGEKRSSPQAVSRFSVYQKEGIVFYRFYVDLSAYGGSSLYFAVYDYTFFCDFRYDEKNPVIVTGAGALNPSYTIAENKKYPVYYDPLDTADMMTIYDTWKPGLLTYYPKEIHLSY